MSRELGRWGEEKAADYLRRRGYKIIGMNYSCRMGEIDIIAENRKYVVFAEVKLRKSDKFGQAREYVTGAKQERLRITAQMWLASNETDKQPRFDVIEIYAPDGENSNMISIEHIENAF